jgi:hypothetical protein
MLNVYREWHMQPEKTKGSWCSANSINGKAIRGIRETVNEVLNILTSFSSASRIHSFETVVTLIAKSRDVLRTCSITNQSGCNPNDFKLDAGNSWTC